MDLQIDGIRCRQVSSNVIRRTGKNRNRGKKEKKKELDVGIKT